MRPATNQNRLDLAIETSEVLWQGALIVAKDDGLRCKAAANETSTVFLGLNVAQATGNTGGTVSAEYIMGPGVLALLPTTGLTAGDVGVQVFCADDNKVCAASTLGPKCGVYRAFDSTGYAWIDLNASALGKAS